MYIEALTLIEPHLLVHSDSRLLGENEVMFFQAPTDWLRSSSVLEEVTQHRRITNTRCSKCSGKHILMRNVALIILYL